MFFTKGEPTQKIWYYQLDPGRSLGKTNPLNDEDLKEFVTLQKCFADSEKSWSISFSDIDKTTLDLSVKNPNGQKQEDFCSPKQIINEILLLDEESARIMKKIEDLI